MDELTQTLGEAYQEYRTSTEQSIAVDGSVLSSTVDSWVGSLRHAFYSPLKPAQDTSISKFLLLERSVLEAFEAISRDSSRAFWSLIVCVVIALAHEPDKAAPPLQDPTESFHKHDVVPAQMELTSKRKATKPAARVKTQPNAPVAFVVIGALRKLISLPERESNHRKNCVFQGRDNEELKQFWNQELHTQTRTVDIKLLVEIFELFQVQVLTVQQIRALAADLLATKQHSSLLKLVQTTLGRMYWDFTELMRAMIQSKDWGSAELVAKTFDEDPDRKVLARILVDDAINLQDFKRAHRIVCNFGLQHEFPDIEQLYSRDALLKLIEKQKWTLALSYVGSDATLHALLLSHLISAREWRHATVLARDRMGLVDFDLEKQAKLADDDDDTTKSGAASSLAGLPVNGYLELALAQEDVVVCDTEESIREAAVQIFGVLHSSEHQPFVGLDVEWRPTSTKIASHTGSMTTTAVASILQVATASKAFLIDLLALHNCDFLFERFLLELFTSNRFLKIGFGFDSDLKVLHQTFPERSAFRGVAPFLELSSVVQKAFGAKVGNSLSNATSRILVLTDVSHFLQRMQLSNWDGRPLSHSQAVYAALDAFCLVQVANHIKLHGLSDDKASITTWEDINSQMLTTVGLSSPIQDPASIAEAVAYRTKYQADWESKLHHQGVIESEDLISSIDVQRYWAKRTVESSDLELDGSLVLLPTSELQPLLAVVEKEPTAYVAVNSICFFADEKACVACIDSNSKLDTSRLAGLCGISRRKIKLATAMECETIWGFSPGTVPPFGHRTPDNQATKVTIFVDVNLRDYDKWVTGSGAHDQLLVFSSAAFFHLITIRAISDIALQRYGSSLSHQSQHANAGTANASESSGSPRAIAGDGANDYKFLADTMVGRVGRWLRTIGIDCVIWANKTRSTLPRDGTFADRQSELLALAAREQRIILTRDKKLADRRDAGACFVVSSDDPHQQFQEIKTHFALVLKREDMMTRCAVCNFKGFEVVDRAYVQQHMADVVAENVLELVTDFWKCLACDKLYWVGPKYSSAYENMLAKFQDI